MDFLALLIKFRLLCEKQWLAKQAKTKIDFSILNFSSDIFGRTFQFMCWINLFVSENTFNVILSNRLVLESAMIWSRCLMLLRLQDEVGRWSKNVHFLWWFECDFKNSLHTVINASLLMRFQQKSLLFITRLYSNLLKPKCLIENDVNIE